MEAVSVEGVIGFSRYVQDGVPKILAPILTTHLYQPLESFLGTRCRFTPDDALQESITKSNRSGRL